jgi:hypothetical protein
MSVSMFTQRQFYSVRTGKNKNTDGFNLEIIKTLFLQIYEDLRSEGYFDEYLGWYCVDIGEVAGHIKSPSLDILIKLRKDYLWPIDQKCPQYNEDDLLDMIEYLFTIASKPVEGHYHSFSNCGMHWHKFDKQEGEVHYREKINSLLALYINQFDLSESGEVLHKAEKGFDAIFSADPTTEDEKIRTRIEAAIMRFRRHGSSIDDRRQAVRDLADVCEYLRPQMKLFLNKKDESDLFNIANNFGIRHHNSTQKTDYDSGLWLNWMFYLFLSTIHVVLRKVKKEEAA